MDLRRPLADALLAAVSEFVAQRIGLHFPPERWRDMERGLEAAAREFGLADAETCARALLASPLTHAQLEVLASHLTVGETYFFREKNSFAALEEHIFPELLRARRGAERRLRIWCAGCCTGEEPYSVAMLLDRLMPDAEAWNLSILGTDINPRFLKKAAEGVYGEWSFRDTPGWVRERYFTRRRDGRYELQPRIRKRVMFSHLNLADDAYPSLVSNTNAMDVILCRNVLMYFTAEQARQAAANLRRALMSGGWLIVSPTETSNALFAPLSPVQFPGALLYRNAGGGLPRSRSLPRWRRKCPSCRSRSRRRRNTGGRRQRSNPRPLPRARRTIPASMPAPRDIAPGRGGSARRSNGAQRRSPPTGWIRRTTTCLPRSSRSRGSSTRRRSRSRARCIWTRTSRSPISPWATCVCRRAGAGTPSGISRTPSPCFARARRTRYSPRRTG